MYDDVLEIIRRTAPELEMTDEEITKYIEIYADMVSKRYFGKFYNKALALFVAHYISISNIVSDEGASNSSLIAGNVIMEKEGDLQRQYSNNNGNSSSYNSGDDLLNKTIYGKLYISLRSAVRPIGMMRKCP